MPTNVRPAREPATRTVAGASVVGVSLRRFYLFPVGALVVAGGILGQIRPVESFSLVKWLSLVTGAIVAAVSIHLSRTGTPFPEPRTAVRSRGHQDVL